MQTDASAKTRKGPQPVLEAIRQGAEKSGVDFGYLASTAERESNFKPDVKAKSSSASGLFQFIEQTWLGLVKNEGSKVGLGDYALSVTKGQDGTHRVADPDMKRTILGLREDPSVASVLAGAFTKNNRDSLAAHLDREPSGGDLYVAHVLGASGAADLIRTAQRAPDTGAATLFPAAAAANRNLFYDRGKSRSVGELYAVLTAQHSKAGLSAAPAFAADKPLAFAHADGPAFHGLFKTNDKGPVSDQVAGLWGKSRTEPQTQTAALDGFFPRSDRSPVRPPEVTLAGSSPTSVPLPPARPLQKALRAYQAQPKGGAPLELSSFMKWRKA